MHYRTVNSLLGIQPCLRSAASPALSSIFYQCLSLFSSGVDLQGITKVVDAEFLLTLLPQQAEDL